MALKPDRIQALKWTKKVFRERFIQIISAADDFTALYPLKILYLEPFSNK